MLFYRGKFCNNLKSVLDKPERSPGDGQNTDPHSMDFLNGLPEWTTLKLTTPKNEDPNEYYLKL